MAIAGLDIGTTKICCVIAQKNATGVQITGMGMVPSPGIRQGQVFNIEETARAARKAVDKAQQMAGIIVSSAVVGIADRTIKSGNCTGMISLNGAEVTQDHIQKVLASARSSATVADCELIHIIPREFQVDGLEEIVNPLGMTCSRLEVRAHLVTVGTNSVRNITKACQRAGIEVNSVVLQSLASSDAVLTVDEMEMGVALIDIGGGTTDIAVFKNGVLWYTAELAVGGSDITGDLARQLRILPGDAEQLKLQHGGCFAERGEQVSAGNKTFYRTDIVNIITARIEELITDIATHTRRSRHGGRLVAGLVLTGGTAQLPGLDLFLEQMTNVPVRIGRPKECQGLADMIANPACSTAVGLVLHHRSAFTPQQNKQEPVSKGFLSWLKELF